MGKKPKNGKKNVQTPRLEQQGSQKETEQVLEQERPAAAASVPVEKVVEQEKPAAASALVPEQPKMPTEPRKSSSSAFSEGGVKAQVQAIEDRMERKYQIVVFGATGFTGGMVCRFLSTFEPNKQNPQEQQQKKLTTELTSWAIVGRDVNKLNKVLADCKSQVADIIVCDDMKNEVRLTEIVKQAKVVITTAGPFAQLGQPLLKCCIQQRTHYLDLTGEINWVQQQQEELHQLAQQNRVVVCCSSGFDSIPSDLTCFFGLQEFFRAKQLRLEGEPQQQSQPELAYGRVIRVRNIFEGFSLFSGGTFASALGSLNLDRQTLMKGAKTACGQVMSKLPLVSRLCKTQAPPQPQQQIQQELRQQQSSFALLPHQAQRQPSPFEKDVVLLPRYDPVLDRYVTPFIMAGVNTRVVRKSIYLREQQQQPQQQRIEYNEFAVAPSFFGALKSTFVQVFMLLFVLLFALVPQKMRNCLQGFLLPQQGEGPTAYYRAKSWFRVVSVVTEEPELPTKQQHINQKTPLPQVVVNMIGGDGGYEQTAQMISCCGLLLSANKDIFQRLPCAVRNLYGFITPATAFGYLLMQKLEEDTQIRFCVLFNNITPRQQEPPQLPQQQLLQQQCLARYHYQPQQPQARIVPTDSLFADYATDWSKVNRMWEKNQRIRLFLLRSFLGWPWFARHEPASGMFAPSSSSSSLERPYLKKEHAM